MATAGAARETMGARFGRFEVDPRTLELRRDGVRVKLQEQPFLVLAVLLERPGELVTREELQQRLWPQDTFVGFDHGLNNAVRRLREALGDSAESPRFVETVPRSGYRFVAPVERFPLESKLPPAPAPGPALLPLLAAAATGALVAAAVLAVLRPAPLPPEPPLPRLLTHSGRDRAPAFSPDGAMVAFASERDSRQRIWLSRLRTGEETPLTSGPRDDQPRFSPDGSALLFVRPDAAGILGLYRVSVLGGEPRQVLDRARAGDWSPDGRHLAFIRWPEPGTATHVLGVAAADGAGARELARVEAVWMTAPRFSPDSRTVAVAHGEGAAGLWSLLLLEPESGRREHIPLPQQVGSLSAPLFTPSGRALLFAHLESPHASFGTRLVRRGLPGGETRTLLRALGFGLGFDRGPRGLVFEMEAQQGSLREVSLQGEAAERWLTRGAAEDRQPVYAPDGARVVFSSNRSGGLDLWEAAREHGALRRLTDDPADDLDPCLTAGGQLFWSSNRSGAFEIWTARPDGSSPRQVSQDGFDAENPSATPDGAWIVYASSHPQKRGLWKVRADGSGATRLVAATVGLPEVSPDGQHVLFSEYNPPQITLRVLRLEDGGRVPFAVRLHTGGPFLRVPRYIRGRARWLPGGRAIAFTDLDAEGRTGIVVQDFAPGADTTDTRRVVAGFERDLVTESFGVSPDGRHLVLATRQSVSNLVHVSGLALDE